MPWYVHVKYVCMQRFENEICDVYSCMCVCVCTYVCMHVDTCMDEDDVYGVYLRERHVYKEKYILLHVDVAELAISTANIKRVRCNTSMNTYIHAHVLTFIHIS